jgi:Ca-activated chloride channel family protein
MGSIDMPLSFLGESFEFADWRWSIALWGVLALGIIGLFAARYRSRVTRHFADRDRQAILFGKRRAFVGLCRAFAMTLGLVLIVGATMRPRANPHQETTEAKGRDIVFLIDVSRSMLARDVAPNRLERAKLWITDLVAELDTDRIGLVAFAGSSSVQSPLTTDRLFFDLALDELSPKSVDMGGTNIGDAIRRCMDMVFYDLEDSESASHRDIILITDGEDQESLPIEAAAAAGAAGIRILALGIGSEGGARVLDEDNRPIRQGGEFVQSRLDSRTLSKIATATPGGAYLEIGTGDIDLAEVYRDLIARGDQANIGSATVTRWDERYAIALAPGLALICIEMMLAGLGLRKEVAS